MKQNPSPESTLQLWKSVSPYLILSYLLLLAIYWQTLASMISTWWNIGTYTHGLVIFPISIWVIWTLKNSLLTIPPTPTIQALIALCAVSIIWLIANLGGLVGIQQFALITLIQVLTLTLLGKTVYKALLFPLLFLYLAVPFGDFLIRPMMEFTADFTVILLRLSGIPVYRNGLYFMLPTGGWSVVAACSGVRYLIASITVGILFAYFCYSSLSKRLVFTAVSIITPIIANGLRAYIIVLIGHFSNMKLATGVDHYIYGWLFFGIVIAIMMWVGSLFQDQPQPDHNYPDTLKTPNTSIDQKHESNQVSKYIIIASLALVISAIGPFLALLSNQQPQHRVNLESITPPESRLAWQLTEQLDDWHPGYSGQSLQLSSMYKSQMGHVQLTMIFYPNESQGHELINGQNSLIAEDTPDWRLISESSRSVSLPPAIKVRESIIGSTQHRLIWQFNWINGEFQINDIETKIIGVKNRILGHENHSIAVLLSTNTGEDTLEAQQRLTDFLHSMSPLILQIIDRFNTLTTTD